MANNNMDILHAFLETGWHGHDWTLDTWAVVAPSQLIGQPRFLVNDDNGHAERHAIDFIFDQLESEVQAGRDLETIEQTIYLSRSPCSPCSNQIVQLASEVQQDHPSTNLQLNLIFSSLYNVTRPSCVNQGHHHLLSGYESVNLLGLTRLRNANVGLGTFTEDDWMDLAGLLDIQPDADLQQTFQERCEEDDNMRDDLNAIVPQ